MLRSYVHLAIAMVTGLRFPAFMCALLSYWEIKSSVLFCFVFFFKIWNIFIRLVKTQNSILSGMITDQLNSYNVDKHNSKILLFLCLQWYGYSVNWRLNGSFMRLCKSCHNEMLIVVNFDRPRPLYRPFSHYATAVILVFKNNKNFSLLESANIYYHLGKSIWSPRQQSFSSELKIKVGPKFLVVRVWRIMVNKNKSRGLGWVP